MAPIADPTQKNVTVAGLALAVTEAGSGSPVVVLHRSIGLHGWGAFEDALCASRRVLVPDLPGFGHSDRPDWAREPRDLAIIINSLVNKLELADVTLVGLGLGGFIAAELATFQPGWLSKLVLVSAGGVKPPAGETLDQMLMAHDEYVKAGFSDTAKYVAAFGEKVTPDVKDVLEFSRIMTARICWSPYMFSRRLPPLLGEITASTVVAWGDDDNVIPVASGEVFADQIAGARLEIFPAAGHLIELEQPTALAALITES